VVAFAPVEQARSCGHLHSGVDEVRTDEARAAEDEHAQRFAFA
jgi:hypothetical protein